MSSGDTDGAGNDMVGGDKDGSSGAHTFTYTWHTIVDQGEPNRSNFRIQSL